MKTVLWISFYFVTFMGLVLGMYFSKDKIVEETQDMPVLSRTEFHEYVATIDSTSLYLVDSLGVVMEGMLGQLGDYVAEIQKRDSTIQALKAELALLYQERDGMKGQIEVLEEMNKDKIDQEKQIQDLAKTLGSMKADVLGPILENLPDDVIRIMYDKAKSKDRTKLFNALAPERAGKIMRKMTEKRSVKAKDA